MFKKTISFLLILCLMLSLAVNSFAAGEETGEETVETVIISSLEQFLEFSRNCTLSSFSQNKVFELKCEIDLEGTDFEPVPCFFGTFNGNGHSVSGLEVSRDGSRQGLFRIVEEGAEISSLKVRGSVTPGGTEYYIGGIAGINKGIIDSCTFEGTVEGIENVGGIAGQNEITGEIKDCTVSGNINGEHCVGGIAGLSSGSIVRCTNKAKVNTVSIIPEGETHFNLASFTTDDFLDITSIGGIAGSSSGRIERCSNSGEIGYINVGYNVGGIAGTNYGFVLSCENRGNIIGRKDIGGICGQLIPYTELDLDSSKIKSVQGAINALNQRIDEATAVTKDQAGSISAELNNIKIVSGNLIDQIEYVTTEQGSGMPYDTSGLIQAINDFYAEYEILATVADTAVGELAISANSVSAGMAGVFSSFSEMLGNIGVDLIEVDDISVEDPYAFDDGAIESSKNYASVSAESCAGGVTGNVAFEITFDAEDTLKSADYMINEAKEYLFSSIRKCKSYGTIETKNEKAGGIAGSSDIGIIIGCTGAGAVKSRLGDYVGGIAGNTQGTIQDCSSRVLVSGTKYIGGIAGCAANITGCTAYTVFDTYSEYAGAVAGFCSESAEGNIYVDTYPAGVDGISYTGQSDPVPFKELASSDDVPELFEEITVRFVGPDGKTIKTEKLEFGDAVTEFPEVSMDGEKYWKWNTDGLDAVYYSIRVKGQYCSPVTTLATPEEVPLVLVEGQFYEGQELSVIPYSNSEVPNPIVAKTVTVSDYEGDLFVRVFAEENGVLYIVQDDGSLKRASCSTDGRYKTFTLENGGSFVYAPRIEKGTAIKGGAIAGCAAAVAAAAAVIAIEKKKKKSSPEEITQEEDKKTDEK